MTAEEKRITELLNDQWWRLNNLYFIVDKRGNKVRFKLNWAQRSFLSGMHYLNEVLKVRQLGISTLMAVYMLDRCLFNDLQTCGIVDKTEDDVKKKLGKIRFAWDNLDYDDGTEEGKMLAAIGANIKLERGTKKKSGEVEPAKANEKEIVFNNKSMIWGGVSLRGGTTQFLHISELGAVAYEAPKKAEEIKSGALNTVLPGPPGQFIVSESTHIGGKFGVHYDICELAMSNIGKEKLDPMQWKFFFFSWLEEEEYRADPSAVTLKPRDFEYQANLKKAHGITLKPEQAAWHSMKWDEQKDAMFREFPTVPSEAFDALIKGSIYGPIISDLRANGKITDFVHDQVSPVVTAWDIGNSDYTSIWAIQMVGQEIIWLDWYENNREPAKHYANKMIEWERKYGPIAQHFLPHDANTRGVGSNETYVDYLDKAGLRNVTVVPRTPDIWVAINALRDLLPRSVFHKTNTGTEREKDGKKFPSGLACLEGYHTNEDSTGATIKEMPVHDAFSHSSDAARTFAQAHSAGLVQSYFAGGTIGGHRRKRRVRVNTGFNGSRGSVRVRR